jgi:S-adenosylmethionine decarboxylase
MVGLHVIFDFYGCDDSVLGSHEALRALLRRAADAGGFDVRGAVDHEYEPQGFSAVLLLAESHISIHTWPEVSFAGVDLFSCKDHTDVDAIQHCLEAGLLPQRCERRLIRRGVGAKARARHWPS